MWGVTPAMTDQMYAAMLDRAGQAPRYELFPEPVPTAGEAVVTVTAAALKPSDRLMARGVHYVPAAFPQVAGLDGVGALADGSRVAFFGLVPPYGGMAQRALVRRGAWLPVPDWGRTGDGRRIVFVPPSARPRRGRS